VVREAERKEQSKGKLVIGREYQGRQSSKENDHGQINKHKKTPMSSLEHLAENKERQAGEALKAWVKLA
jgi:hypothetical protein